MFIYFKYSGMSFYSTDDNTNGYIYTSSSDGFITKYDVKCDKIKSITTKTLNITASSIIVDRAPAAVSFITVDWLNDMLYWLETVNNTHIAVSVVCGQVYCEYNM